MKKLIAYFSASGTTAAAAAALAGLTGASLYEIRPEVPYTASDLDWTDKGSRSSVEMKDGSSRPAISGELPDTGAYDAVYIGFPIWWGVVPRIIDSFIEGCSLEGKDIAVFATSGGSGIEPAVRDLQRKYPSLRIRTGRLLDGRVTEDIL